MPLVTSTAGLPLAPGSGQFAVEDQRAAGDANGGRRQFLRTVLNERCIARNRQSAVFNRDRCAFAGFQAIPVHIHVALLPAASKSI